MLKMIKRMAGTLLAMLQTRAELLAVEVEEEVQRLFGYLMLSLVALFCFGIAVLLAILLIIILFWDTNRVAVVACLMGFFAITAICLVLWLRNSCQKKPRFLSATLNELSKDVEALTPSGREDEQ
jgi:uncharacterized membrane protein YqjE